MIKASAIYVVITCLLALFDAYRIKKAKGIVENINHKVSSGLGFIGMVIAVGPFWPKTAPVLLALLYAAIACLACAFIRLAIFDPCLNLERRMKIDYESSTTSSYVDQHTGKLSFWQKRAIGVAGWGLLLFIHYAIFKTI
jgi:hypothetical protein